MKMYITPLLEGKANDSTTTTTTTIEFIEKDGIQPRQFIHLLDQHKALLLRSSSSSVTIAESQTEPESYYTTEDFATIVTNLQLTYYPYIGGAAPRTVIPNQYNTDIIFTANESPPDQPIPFHHELAQTDSPPEYIFFYCHTPCDPVDTPEGQGQTPIIDSTLVYRYVAETYPEYLSKLQEHGVRYIRTLPASTDITSPIGRSYQDTYNVADRIELEKKLQSIIGCSWEWIPYEGRVGSTVDDDDACVRVTSPAIPAIRFVSDHCTNHVYQYTFANSIIAAYLGWQDNRNNRFDAIRFGNMDPMDINILNDIAQFMHNNRILYTWKKGDIMALNNRLVMHSRNPFVGPRRVFASIWGPPLQHVWNIPQPNNGIAIGSIPPSYFEPIQPTDPLVFGFWKVPKDDCATVCYNAIKVGYRRFDCACDYGNEVQVGIGIAKAIADRLCERKDLFITSKLWNTYHTHADHVIAAIQKSLADLQLSYLDEYLIHFPISMEYIPIDIKYPPEWTNMENKMVLVPNDICGTTWKAMETLVDMGLTRTIGVCNFSTQLLRQLLSTCRIRPTTLQIELHPHNTQDRLVKFAHDAGIHVTAFSVLGASSYIELNMATTSDILLLDPTIVEIAKQKRKSPAQILLRWALQRNTFPLCKSSNIERMKENRTIYDFYLNGTDMKHISSLNKNKRYNDPGEFCEPGMGTFCPIYD